jgi:predicted nucleic acid-binding protein
MSGIAKRYLFDTNIFIYYFNGELILKQLFDEALSGQAVVLYCPISWVELLCYPALTTNEAEQIRYFLKRFECVELTEDILDKAAQIRMDYRTAVPDAIIAACASMTDSTLVTRNEDDFKRISDVAILNPFAETTED